MALNHSNSSSLEQLATGVEGVKLYASDKNM